MEDEARVLEQRVQFLSVERGGVEARERVRGEQQEGEERRADHPLHGERARQQPVADTVAEARQPRAEHREDQHPEQHRALVVPPRRGEAVENRLRQVRMARDECDREVAHDEAARQRAERDEDQQPLQLRGGAPRSPSAPDRRAPPPSIGTTDCASASSSARISANCPISAVKRFFPLGS